MARTSYSFEKRRREAQKRAKKAAKKEKRELRKAGLLPEEDGVVEMEAVTGSDESGAEASSTEEDGAKKPEAAGDPSPEPREG